MAPKVVFTTTAAGTPGNLAGVLDFAPLTGPTIPKSDPLPTNGATAVCDADGHLAVIVSPALVFGGMPGGSGGPVVDLWDISVSPPKKLSSLSLPATGSAGAVAIAMPRIAVALASGFQVGLIDCLNVNNLKFIAWSPMLSVGGLDSVGIASIDDSSGAHCVVYAASSGGIFNAPMGNVGFAEIDFGPNPRTSMMVVKDNLDPAFPQAVRSFNTASVDAKQGLVAVGKVIAANANSPMVDSPVVLLRSSTRDFAFGAGASQTALPATIIGNVAIAGDLQGA
jgi:hypothetical protein